MAKRVEVFLAVKLMKDSRLQTGLTITGVAVGMAVVVYLTALISGLQASLMERVLGSQAHVSLLAPELVARPLINENSPNKTVVTRIESTPTVRPRIENWQSVLSQVKAIEGVQGASAIVTSPGLIVSGQESVAVSVFGIDGKDFASVISFDDKILVGQLDLSGNNVVIGDKLADEVNVAMGDTLRIQVAAGKEDYFKVAGVFSLGVAAADESWLLISRRRGQALFGLSGAVTRIDLKLRDAYGANQLGRRLRGGYKLKVETWMEKNAQLLTALQSQSLSSTLIEVFVMIAVAIGVASVLVVSVYQRRQEIGILRAVGLSRKQVLRVFVLQGGMIGAVGALIGIGAGIGLAEVFSRTITAADGKPMFAMLYGPTLVAKAFIVALGTGLIASFIPAKRASGLEPVEAIRQ